MMEWTLAYCFHCGRPYRVISGSVHPVMCRACELIGITEEQAKQTLRDDLQRRIEDSEGGTCD
jgi:hypothetical protein